MMIDEIKRYFESKNAPVAEFNMKQGVFKLEGRSILDVAEIYYEPLYSDFKEYSDNPRDVTDFQFKMEYFNTSSSKWILKLFYVLDDMYKAGHTVKVSWAYDSDDEDMLEAGEDYGEMVDFDLELIPVAL